MRRLSRKEKKRGKTENEHWQNGVMFLTTSRSALHMAFPHESPPPDGDVSRQTGALIAIWVLFGVSSVVMVLRVFAQATVIRRPSLDDGLMIAAWVSVEVVQKKEWY